MKVVIWCLVVVGVYFVYQYTVGNVFREYERCYTNSERDIAAASTTTSQSNQCVVKKLVYDEMLQCFTELQATNNLAGMLYDATPVSKTVTTEFELHNDECPLHKIIEPKMSLYLNTGSKR